MSYLERDDSFITVFVKYLVDEEPLCRQCVVEVEAQILDGQVDGVDGAGGECRQDYDGARSPHAHD